MIKIKNMNLAVRLSVLISLVALFCIAGLVFIVRSQMITLSQQNATEIAHETTLHYPQLFMKLLKNLSAKPGLYQQHSEVLFVVQLNTT